MTDLNRSGTGRSQPCDQVMIDRRESSSTSGYNPTRRNPRGSAGVRGAHLRRLRRLGMRENGGGEAPLLRDGRGASGDAWQLGELARGQKRMLRSIPPLRARSGRKDGGYGGGVEWRVHCGGVVWILFSLF